MLHRVPGRVFASLPLCLLLLAAPSSSQTTGLIPITDLGAGTYSGYPGGLYPGGVNNPPAGHLADALAKAAEIVPRDAAGVPNANGWIAMIAVGMSNTTHEFGAFERNADADSSRNARVVLLDTGFGGQTATAIANPNAPYWTTMANRLAAMGLTAAQVQVAWLKEAEAMPPNNFPLHAEALRDTLKTVVNNLRDKFPNLRICYVSSRIYGGYSAPGTLNPEPQAYESGFSVKWLIEDQIDGDPALNYGQLPGAVEAPLLLWGPYLWADGVNPRSDGLTWTVGDLESDHVHPSPAGEQKVAGLLAGFFATEATAAAWWPGQPGERLVSFDAIHDSHVSAAAPSTNYGSDPLLACQGGAMPITTYLRFDLDGESRPIHLAKLSLRVSQAGGGAVRRVDDTSWGEGTITYATAPAIGTGLVGVPQASKDGTLGVNVTGEVVADADGQLSLALTSSAQTQATYHSKEGGQPPRLVLVVTNPVSSVGESSFPAHRLLLVNPNPVFRDAHIAFELSETGMVDLAIHSIGGRLIRRLLSEERPAGRHEARWNGRNAEGQVVPAGVYIVRLAADGTVRTVKVVRVRRGPG